MQLSGGERLFQAQRTASANALRQEYTWGDGDTLERPVRMEHREQERLGWGEERELQSHTTHGL